MKPKAQVLDALGKSTPQFLQILQIWEQQFLQALYKRAVC